MSDSLTQPSGYDPKQMVFSKPSTNTIPTKKGPPITYQRINITTKGKKELIFPTPKVFSFGVSENTDPTSGRVTGFVLPLVLYERDGASEEEKEFVEMLEKIIEHCKNHVLDKKDELEKYDLTRGELKKIGNALYWPSEKGKRLQNRSPVLYSKLLTNKSREKITSGFYDANTDEVLDPMTLIGKRCHVVAALKVESIFIGRVITIQFKCREANIELHNYGHQRLLPHKKVTTTLVGDNASGNGNASDNGNASANGNSSDNASDNASGNANGNSSDSDSESSASLEPPPKKVVKKVIKRRVVRKKK